jgi:hypothetical protein
MKTLFLNSRRIVTVGCDCFDSPLCMRSVIDMIPITTRKKLILKFFLQLMLKIGFLRKLFSDDIGFFGEKNSLSNLFSQSIIFWPSNRKRMRFFMYRMNVSSGMAISFYKVAFDDENNLLLMNEKDMLEKMSDNKEFSVPKLISCGHFHDWFYLEMSLLPEKCKLLINYKEQIVSEQLLNYLDLPVCSRMKVVEIIKKGHGIYKSLIRYYEVDASEFVDVNFSHCDLGSDNVYVSEDGLWVIDWERAAFDAPFYVDRISYFLGYFYNLYNGDMGKIRKEFEEKFMSCDTGHDVIVAVVYLHLVEFTPATELINDVVGLLKNG